MNIEAKFHVEPQWDPMGNESEYTNGLCHVTKMATMPIYRTERPITMKLGVQQ